MSGNLTLNGLSHLVELNDLAREEGRRYPKRRSLYDALAGERGKHFSGVVGPRGVGKTVLLRQLAGTLEDAFYLSVDTLDGDEDLFGLLQKLNRDLKVRVFLLDEVHFHRDFDAVLKKTYDFLDVRVIFTSSVSLAMFASSFDLSRRVRLMQLLPFSLREYAFFARDRSVSPLSLSDIRERRWAREHLDCAPLFEDYLRGGLMPYALEELDVLPLLENILNKTITSDLPRVARLTIDELEKIHKLLRFIGRSEVDGINYSSISRNVGVTKYKAESYVKLLEKAFVLQVALPAGTNVLREPKVLMSVPYRLLYREYREALGGLREDFFAEMMRAGGISYQYLKTKRGAKTPDYLVRLPGGDLVVEIGGKGKGRSQFKGLSADEKLIFTHADSFDDPKRPLFLLGLVA